MVIARASLFAIAVLALGTPAVATASPTQESTFQDDALLVAGSPATVARTLDTLRALGVDRVRATVVWRSIAPAPEDASKPTGFDAANPSAYPAGAWERYDRLVQLARSRSLAVGFVLTAPAPNWATGSFPTRPEIDSAFDPRGVDFELFVRAVATRYNGRYVLPTTAVKLPAVRYWSIWSEPNDGAALSPQWLRDPREPTRAVETGPQVYRRLVDAAWTALRATGHGGDTILIGETAPTGALSDESVTGSIDPQRFIRRLYCLDDNLQFLRGSSAEVRGCPVSNPALEFRRAHPALFAASGWAHHPYERRLAPDRRPARPQASLTLGNLDALSRLLRRIRQRYGQSTRSDVPLYLTRHGYETKPADPGGVSEAQQAEYLDHAEYLAWLEPSVRTLGQLGLRDFGPPNASGWRGGLSSANGRRKPSWDAYRLPLWLRSATVRPGATLEVWGLVRPGRNGTRPRVRISIRATGSKAWRPVATVTTTAPRGYLDVSVPVQRSGEVRLTWNGHASRAAAFEVQP